LLAIVSIVRHSAASLSGERGRSVIRLIRYRYGASLCSVGWFEVKLMVVLGLRYMSMSMTVGSREISSSRKFMLFCSGVGVNFKFGCNHISMDMLMSW
jgi:hypothetical protein